MYLAHYFWSLPQAPSSLCLDPYTYGWSTYGPPAPDHVPPPPRNKGLIDLIADLKGNQWLIRP